MRYVPAGQAALVVLVVMGVAVWFVPHGGASNDVEIILTVSTFLFAIMAGFFTSRLSNRYEKIREAVSLEDASFLTLYKQAELLSPEAGRKVADRIDYYYVKGLEFPAPDYYKQSFNAFCDIYTTLRELKSSVKTSSDAAIYEEMIDLMRQLEESRNRTSVISTERLTPGQWSILIFLSVIIAFSLFYIRITVLYSEVITAVLITILALVIFILRDFQNLRLFGQTAITESAEEVIEAMGFKRYYNAYVLKSGTRAVPKYVDTLRLGLHKPGEKINIKEVKRSELREYIRQLA